ncbi:DNA helicase PcrA [Levilactobacillus brevis]|uniref:ATP-dependent DNA helicase n=1 Tax=Levilactobacillus brevis TaxID=1580 RepID=A0A0C1PU47_LEVBR|nr:DNA helicase PcrA [Levilactobacillus brevis]ANN49507.1 ATP-dependent DNA helicase PcrA [Levilactobacillus brevis]ARN95660.1 DNA helicase PcrA [Levilactobacillus brevis]ARQ92307.1 ATP-dependent DNA helicase PcrA [Levilactobacillus brevis]KID44217.1 ATP-dependent DNA helicase UvrD/PcrA [Levilactobacillus brevis]KIO99566.1 ATP-dependent DNA helicase UvrD/PcrA [Levilactobacillus brevis]
MAGEELLTGMNDKQTEAVLQTEGPLLVLAGAGSGKTRVLTHRVAYLIEHNNVMPWRILAITFTNKAAKEMRERVIKLLGPDGNDVWVSTFHALCVRILRRDADKLGYNRAFTIADPGEQRTLIKRVLQQQNLDIKKFDPRSVLGAISNAKNALQTPAMMREAAGNPFETTVATVYESYQRELQANQAMDFDDLIMLTIKLFNQDADVLGYYQDKFQYIHVDEYQDTNDAQYTLVNLLAKKHGNLCVVGDGDQSIYGWRGANMENILNFEHDYPDAHVTLLEQNYRSTKTILRAANDVIQRNVNRKKKDLWTDNAEGEPISYYRGQNENDEAHYVVAKIQEEREQNHHDYGDFAILYRTNAQSRVIEETLVKANIPYTMVGGHKFYDRKEIRDVLAYLTLVANPADSMSLERIINEPKRGIGATSVEKLRDFAEMNDWTELEATQNISLATTLGARVRTAMEKFGLTLKHVQDRAATMSVSDMTSELLDQTGYMAALKASKNLEAETRIENIEEFLSVTQKFDDDWDNADHDETEDRLVEFLADLALVSAQDDVEEEPAEVTLMTLHAAKGLEFPVIFLMGLEEGIFPLSRAMLEDDELEEERRLAYVGITRAQEKLYLTNAYSRMLYGRRQTNPQSRFVTEIAPELLHLDYSETKSGLTPSRRDVPFARRTASAVAKPYAGKTGRVSEPTGTGAGKVSWTIGDKASHKKWGVGTVVKVNGTGEDAELDIAFPEQGIKRLLAAFAPIKRVD